MGMYDTIKFKCPNPDCEETIFVQSKGGACLLREYEYTSVPMDVATDANRHAPFECKCGATFRFSRIDIPNKVSLVLEKI